MRAAAVAVAALSLTLTACGSKRAADRERPLPPDRAAEVLHERVWLDHAPRSPQDRFHLAIFEEGGAAIEMHRTVWKGNFEVFFYEADGRQIDFFLPSSGTETRSAFRIEPFRGQQGADVKLVIDHPPIGPREYLGFGGEDHGLRATDPTSIDAWLAERFPAARAERPAR